MTIEQQKEKAKAKKILPFKASIDQQSAVIIEWSVTVSVCRKISSFYFKFNRFRGQNYTTFFYKNNFIRTRGSFLLKI